MRREWDLDDLIASWTLVGADQELLARLHSGSRLGFALMLKFFEIEGRFPRQSGELRVIMCALVSTRLAAAAESLGYGWPSTTAAGDDDSLAGDAYAASGPLTTPATSRI